MSLRNTTSGDVLSFSPLRHDFNEKENVFRAYLVILFSWAYDVIKVERGRRWAEPLNIFICQKYKLDALNFTCVFRRKSQTTEDVKGLPREWIKKGKLDSYKMHFIYVHGNVKYNNITCGNLRAYARFSTLHFLLVTLYRTIFLPECSLVWQGDCNYVNVM